MLDTLRGSRPFSYPFLLVAVVATLAVHVGALYLPATQFVLRVEPIELAAEARGLGELP